MIPRTSRPVDGTDWDAPNYGLRTATVVFWLLVLVAIVISIASIVRAAMRSGA